MLKAGDELKLQSCRPDGYWVAKAGSQEYIVMILQKPGGDPVVDEKLAHAQQREQEEFEKIDRRLKGLDGKFQPGSLETVNKGGVISFVTPSRKMFKTGVIKTKIKKTFSSGYEPKFLILLSDVLILTDKPTSNEASLPVNRVFPLSQVISREPTFTKAKPEKMKTTIEIVHENIPYRFKTETTQEKDDWKRLLDERIQVAVVKSASGKETKTSNALAVASGGFASGVTADWVKGVQKQLGPSILHLLTFHRITLRYLRKMPATEWETDSYEMGLPDAYAAYVFRAMQKLRATEFRWNQEFVRALKGARQEEPQDLIKLSDLVEEFVEIAKNYGRTLILESFIPSHQRTTQGGTKLGGVAGGQKEIIRGIVFKLAKDTAVNGGRNWIYGADRPVWEYANKAAGNDLRGGSTYFNALHDWKPVLNAQREIHVPMMAVVDFLGFRMLAMPILPIDGHRTLRYGSDDAGATVKTDDEDINGAIKHVATAYNLAPHRVGESLLWSAGDLEGHDAWDGRAYLLDFGRFSPPEHPHATKHLREEPGSVFYRQFRPEFLRILKNHFAESLSPDALTRWGAADAEFHNENLRKATLILMRVALPQLAESLKNITPENLKRQKFAYIFHSQGVNMRHCGRLLSFLEDHLELCELLTIEMICRTLKNIIRELLRRLHVAKQTKPSLPEYKKELINFLNQLLLETQQPAPKEKFWASLLHSIESRFGRLGNRPLFKKSNPALVLFQITRNNLFFIIDQTLQSVGAALMEDTSRKLKESIEQKANFELLTSDLAYIDARVKYFPFVDYVRGKAFEYQAFAARHSDPAAQYRLLRRAADAYEASLTSGGYRDADVRVSLCLGLLDAGQQLPSGWGRTDENILRLFSTEPKSGQTWLNDTWERRPYGWWYTMFCSQHEEKMEKNKLLEEQQLAEERRREREADEEANEKFESKESGSNAVDNVGGSNVGSNEGGEEEAAVVEGEGKEEVKQFGELLERKKPNQVIYRLANGSKALLDYLVSTKNEIPGLDLYRISEKYGHLLPLTWALLEGRADLVGLMLRSEGAVNFKDARGQTVLHQVVSRPELVEKVLSYGANPFLRDDQGRLALQIAVIQKHYNSARLIAKTLLDKSSESAIMINHIVPIAQLLKDDSVDLGSEVQYEDALVIAYVTKQASRLRELLVGGKRIMVRNFFLGGKQTIDMKNMEYNDSHVLMVAALLAAERQYRVRVLDLGNNKYTSASTRVLCHVLKDVNSLSKVRLQDVEVAIPPLRSQADLDLSRRKLTSKDCQLIAAILKGCSHLTSFKFSENKTGDLGMEELCAALASHRRLRVLEFAEIEVKERGAKALAQLIEELPALESLHFGEVQYDVKHMRTEKAVEVKQTDDLQVMVAMSIIASNSEMISVSFAGSLSDTLAKRLGRIVKQQAQVQVVRLADKAVTVGSLRQSEDVELQDHKYTDVEFVVISEILKENKNMRKINLSGNVLQHVGGAALIESLMASPIESLDLSNSQLGPQGGTTLAQLLAETKSLTHLSINDNKEIKYGLDAILYSLRLNRSLKRFEAKNVGLNYLNAYALAIALEDNRTLTEVNIANNSLEMTGACQLARVLDHSTLITLDIRNNNINDQGIIALALTVEENKVLQNLHLDDNPFSTAAIIGLAEHLWRNETLQNITLTGSKLGEVATLQFRSFVQDQKQQKDEKFRKVKTDVALALASSPPEYLDMNLYEHAYSESDLPLLVTVLKTFPAITKIQLEDDLIPYYALSHDTNLLLYKLNLSSLELSLVVQIIKENKGITTLKIDQTSIGDAGWSSVYKAIEDAKKLTSIELYGLNVTIKGAQQIALDTKTCAELTTFKFGDNPIGNQGVAAFCEGVPVKSLTSFALDNCGLDDSGLDSLLGFLKQATSLTELSVVDAKLSPESLAKLALQITEMKDLKVLKLVGEEKIDIAGLRGDIELKDRLLDETYVLFVNAFLKSNKNISSFAIANIKLESKLLGAIAAALQENTGLRSLSLVSNQFTEAEAAILPKALQDKKNLVSFTIENNEIGDNGLETVLSSVLKSESLCTLRLKKVGMKDASLIACTPLIAAHANISELDFSGNEITLVGAEVLAAHIKEMKNLKKLHIGERELSVSALRASGLFEGEGMGALDLVLATALLEGNTRLSSIMLSGCPLGDAGATRLGQAIRAASQLMVVNLKNTQITEAGLKGLLPGLVGHNTLTSLDLSDNPIGDSGLIAFAQGFKGHISAGFLNLARTGLTSAGALEFASHMKEVKGLKHITLTNSEVSVSALDSIVFLDAQESNWDETALPLVMELVKSSSALKMIRLSSGVIGLDQIRAEKSGDFSGRSLSSKDAVIVASLLKDFKGLESVDVSKNPMEDSGVLSILSAVKSLPQLKKLNLSETDMGELGLTALALFVQESKSLTSLAISAKSMVGGGAALALAMAMNPNITELRITKSKLSDIFCIYMIAFLKQSKIKVLDLRENEISEMAPLIASMIYEAKALESLDLSDNAIDDTGITMISSCLKSLPSLKHINISGNKVTALGLGALLSAVQANRSITKVELARNQFEESAASLIQQVIKGR